MDRFSFARFAAFLLLLMGLVSTCSGQPDHTEQATDMVYQRVDNTTFKSKMQEEGVVILDVRTPAETARGIIDGAIQIDYRSVNFKEKINQLDKEKTYLIYCHSGGRSAKAAQMMQTLGFGSIYELKSGYSGWEK